MFKKFLLLICAMTALFANAERFPVTFSGTDANIGDAGSFIENLQGSYNMWAHMKFAVPESNNDGKIANVDYTFRFNDSAINGGNPVTGRKDVGTGAAVIDTDQAVGTINPGSYTVEMEVKFNDAAGTPLYTYNLTGAFEITKLQPTMTIEGDVVDKENNDARINYNVMVYNYDGDASYLVELFEGNTATGTPVQTKTVKADGFVIDGVTPGAHYEYTIKATVTGEGLDLDPMTRVFWWDQTGSQPRYDYTLEPTATGCNFNYSINFGDVNEDDVESVLICLLKGGEAFGETAEFHSTEKAGTITVNFDGATFGVWLKGELTLKNGTKVNIQPYDFAMTLTKGNGGENPNPETFNVTVSLNNDKIGNFERTGNTAGTLEYEFNVDGTDEELAKIDHFVLFYDYAGSPDPHIAEPFNLTAVAGQKTYNGKYTMAALPNSNAENAIWFKVKAVSKAGKETNAVEKGPVSCNTQAQANYSAEFNYTLESTAAGCDFNYTIAVKGFEESEIASVLVCLLKGGEAFGETAEFHSTEMGGKIAVNFDGATLPVWLKGELTLNDGTKVQVKPWDYAMTLNKLEDPDAFKMTMTVENPVALTATTGRLTVKIEYLNGDNLDHFEGYVVRRTVEGDAGSGDTRVAEFTIDPALSRAASTTVTKDVELTNLHESSPSELWVKVTPKFSDATTYPEVIYPGEAQGWTGLSVNTGDATGIVSVAVDADARGTVYNTMGVAVMNNVTLSEAALQLPAGLYIINGHKFIVR